jgi:hypothetical protein
VNHNTGNNIVWLGVCRDLLTHQYTMPLYWLKTCSIMDRSKHKGLN